ncbi:hypothetical protein B0H17DRAFT_1134965 [Mycena rosella]|uniref:SWIM-type domain-containing protein n=1 Tax=Mycena rosella TaxID=1033263 RepID=A0AAD7DDX2_MYCRO|nr:hypothetical protein B0H17DRAFT_1134965 [Mycena rosella]
MQPVKGRASLEWSESATLLAEHQDKAFELDTFIKMDGPSAMAAFEGVESGVDVAKKMVSLVWAATGYRFIDKKKKTSPASDTVITYNDEQKRQAQMKMDRFPCDGWLHITADSKNPATVRLRVHHHCAHCQYVYISLTDKITKLVGEMRNQPASNIWMCILQENPGTDITQKQIYALWCELNKAAWRLDDDQVKSVQILLEKMHGKEIELIPIHQEDGVHCIAFGFTEVLDGWAEQNKELVMNSTWKTNAAGYELYRMVGKANRQAIPFVFMFTTNTNGTAPEGAKTRMLSYILRYLNQRCPNLIFIDPTWAPGISSDWTEDDDGDALDDSTSPSTCVPPVLILKMGDVHVPVYPNPPKLKATTQDEFCSSEFRSPVVEMFCTHLNQHSTFPRNDPEERIRRLGRPKGLAGWQVNFKATWIDMSRTDKHRLTEKQLKWLRTPWNTKGREEHLQPLEEETWDRGVYMTDIENWMCSCPAYPKNQFLLCKHLGGTPEPEDTTGDGDNSGRAMEEITPDTTTINTHMLARTDTKDQESDEEPSDCGGRVHIHYH